MSSTQSGLQGLIGIAEHYGERYKVTYGAAKTKITVVGSDLDMEYYCDTTPWIMGGQPVKVVEDNDHLGQVVSGRRQEEKNIDERIKKGRGHLFSMLGPAYAYKCMLSPVVKMHLFRTFTCPILRSGLYSFALRNQQMTPLSLFHIKVLKSFLTLSKSAPTPAVHFLLGELPMEGKIHRDMFSLFFGVWSNPDTKIHQIVRYLLTNSSENSRTWAMNMRHIAQMYQLEDPLSCLQRDAPDKSVFKETVMTKITAFHEKELRIKAQKNEYMKYLNVSLIGLRGKHHPCLANIVTTEEVHKLRPYLKFLAGDYLTYQKKFDQNNGQGSPVCRLCHLEGETICHILTICPAYDNKRTKMLQEMAEVCSNSTFVIEDIFSEANPEYLTQFILDPTSINLRKRVHISDPIVPELYRISRDLCNHIHSERMKQLSDLVKRRT